MRIIINNMKKRLILILKSVPLLIFGTFIWITIIKPNINYANGSNEGDNDNGQPFFENVTAPLPFTLNALRDVIHDHNKYQRIQNVDKFGHHLNNNPNGSLVIVVQVHNRASYLSALIDSLQTVAGIESSLIVFSHDIYDLHINSIINNITFCRVLQIFYPYSLQLNPNSFPGTDPNDCPRDIQHDKAIERMCNNAKYPDTYGHYREAKYTQTKHHWFWKTNFVMNQVMITKNYTGNYIFLEEDHLVAPDMLHITHLLENYKRRYCSSCDFTTLGIYVKSVSFAKNGDKFDVQPKWISSRHNMGLVFNREVWMRIMSKCYKEFCSYDDYNWDWSLQHVSLKCIKSGPIKTLVVSAPRVFHVGECGVHHKKKNCYKNTIVNKVIQLLSASKSYLFPTELTKINTIKRNFKMPKVNGGWSDVRDHQLCNYHYESSLISS